MEYLVEFEWKNTLSQVAQPFPAFLAGKPALTRISMVGVNITGSIPSFLGSLTSLTRLNLANIPLITGPIPVSLTQSFKLEILNLERLPSFNMGTSHSMPSDWRQAFQLQSMSFKSVSITGSLPSQPPSALRSFEASSTLLSGAIPQALVDMPMLTTLLIDDCDVNGTIPAPANLEKSNLASFTVKATQATSIDRNVLRIANLEFAAFSNNKLTGLLPSKIGFNDTTPSKITQLTLNQNEFVGMIPGAYFDNTPNLSTIYLSHNKLSGEIPASIVDCKNLFAIDFSNNSLSGQIPGEVKWSELVQLSFIWMNDNYFSGSIPSGLFQRPIGVSAYQHFVFSNNRLDICLLPPADNLTTSFQYSSVCSVINQTPMECGCPARWSDTKLSKCITFPPMEAACPPQEPLGPFPVAPFAPEAPYSPPPPVATPEEAPFPSPTPEETPSPSPSPSPVSSPSPSASPSLSPPRGASRPSSDASKFTFHFVFALAYFAVLLNA